MVQHYFVSAFVPKDKSQHEFYMRKVEGANVYQTGVIVPVAEIAPGAKGEPRSACMPVRRNRLHSRKLLPVSTCSPITLADAVVAAPIFWALQAIHKLVGNCWAIVVLTIILKLIFFPLSAACTSRWPRCAS